MGVLAKFLEKNHESILTKRREESAKATNWGEAVSLLFSTMMEWVTDADPWGVIQTISGSNTTLAGHSPPETSLILKLDKRKVQFVAQDYRQPLDKVWELPDGLGRHRASGMVTVPHVFKQHSLRILWFSLDEGYWFVASSQGELRRLTRDLFERLVLQRFCPGDVL